MEEIDTQPALKRKQPAVHWIKGDSVCVIDGWCYAISPLGRTVCIGKENEVLRSQDEKGMS